MYVPPLVTLGYFLISINLLKWIFKHFFNILAAILKKKRQSQPSTHKAEVA